MERARKRGRLASPGTVAGALLGVAAALVAFLLYLRTLAPTVLHYDPNGLYDSVMLQVKAYVLGIPNPTGYPTYIMLAHLFTYLPFGDVGYRVNLASAVFAALAVFAVYALCRRLTGMVAPAVVAALLFGLSRTFWSQAVIAEVYTLNAFFVAVALLALLIWRETRRDRHLLLAAFLVGLSMTHHMTSGLLLPAALLFVGLVEWRRLVDWRTMLEASGAFLLGLTPYLYLPVRASMDPPLDEYDPSTLGGFLSLVTGSRFESRMFAYGLEEMPGRLSMYAGYLQEQFNPAFLTLAALGVLVMLARDRAALAMLSFIYLGWLVYALGYSIKDVHLYFIPTYLIICVLVATGLAFLLETLERLVGELAPSWKTAVVAVVSVVVMLAPFGGVGRTYEGVDRSWDYRGREIIDAVAQRTERGSTVLHNGSALWYMQLVEGRRLDLNVVDPFPPGGWTARNRIWTQSAERYMREGRVYVIFPGGTAEQNRVFFREAGYDLARDRSGVFHEVVIRQRMAGEG